MLEAESLTVDQVASLLDLSRNTVYKMAKEGALPSYRIGRKLRFSKSDVEAQVLGKAGKQSAFNAGESLSQAVQNLGGGAASLVLAGEDELAGPLVYQLDLHGHTVSAHSMSAYASLVNLYAEEADMALVNLYDQRTNSYNVPYVQRLCPGMSVVVFRLVGRQRGLIVPRENPLKIRSWSSLTKDGLRIAPDQKGSARRILLDQMMLGLEEKAEYALAPASPASNLARVAQGAADVCIGYESDLEQVKGLCFLPLHMEQVDLVVRKSFETRATIRLLRQLLESPAFKSALDHNGNDLGRCGSVAYES